MMKIVVDCRFLSAPRAAGVQAYLLALTTRLAIANPADQFHLVIEEEFAGVPGSPTNLSLVKLGTRPGGLLGTLKTKVGFGALLRRLQPDLLVSPQRESASTDTIPQLLLVYDLGYLDKPATAKLQLADYEKTARISAAAAQKSAAILCFSHAVQAQVQQLLRIPAEKITVTGILPPDSFRQLGWDEMEAVREGLTGGAGYFFYHGSQHTMEDLLNLLKAFSIFKKRQQTSMRLLFALPDAAQQALLEAKLSGYKYRNDVQVYNAQTADLPLMTAAAYAAVCLDQTAGFYIQVMEALQSGVPVLAPDTPQMREVCGNAALYFSNGSPEEIAQQLKLVYKDEPLRAALIAAAATVLSGKNEALLTTELYACMRSVARPAVSK